MTAPDYSHLPKYIQMAEISRFTPLGSIFCRERMREFLTENAGELFGGDESRLQEELQRTGNGHDARMERMRTFYDNLALGQGIYVWVEVKAPELISESGMGEGEMKMNFVGGVLDQRRLLVLGDDEKRLIYPLHEEYIFLSGRVIPILVDSSNGPARYLIDIARDDGIDPRQAVLQKEYRERAMEAHEAGYRRIDIQRTTENVTRDLEVLDNDLEPEISRLSLGFVSAHIDQFAPGSVWNIESVGNPYPNPDDPVHTKMVEVGGRVAREQAAAPGCG